MPLSFNDIGWADLGEQDPRVFKRASLGVKAPPSGVLHLSYDERHGSLIANQEEVVESSLNEVFIAHEVERVKDVVLFLRELYRVCAHGAVIRVWGVYFTHTDTFADPTKLRGLSERMFSYTSAIGREAMSRDELDDGVASSLYTGVDFDVKEVRHMVEPEYESRSDAARYWGIVHNLNVIRRVEIVLMCHKPSREKAQS